MRVVPVETTYLEMRQKPVTVRIVPPNVSCNVRRVRKPTVDFYKDIYRRVGKKWRWVDRLMMDPRELRAIIEDDRVEVYVLYIGYRKAGYVELDRRVEGEIEIAYFGLFPEFIGRGLGKFLLSWAVRKAWTYDPRRLWVHTCTLDHKAALPNYLKAGFTIYDKKTILQRLPD